MFVASVAIPTHREPEVLSRVLDGFAQCAHSRSPSFEVVLCDDGSDPPTVEALGRRSDPFRLTIERHPQNRGRSAACNTAIRACSGEIVIILDADIVPTPSFIRDHVAFHERYIDLEDCLLGDQDWHPEVHRNCFMDSMSSWTNPRMRDFRGLLPWTLWYTCNFSAKKRLLNQCLPPFDEHFKFWGFEDNEFAFRMSQLGARCHMTGTALGHHLKELSFENQLRLVKRAAPYALYVHDKHPEAEESQHWLCHDTPIEALHQLEEMAMGAIYRHLELAHRMRPNAFLSPSENPILKATTEVFADRVFNVGMGRGLEQLPPHDRERIRPLAIPKTTKIIEAISSVALCHALSAWLGVPSDFQQVVEEMMNVAKTVPDTEEWLENGLRDRCHQRLNTIPGLCVA